MTEPLLSATGLTRRFGGLVAVDQVGLALRAGTVHAVIGPNGAGKSTLANVLSGELKPSDGTIRLRGADITGWPANRIARRGLARTFQHTHVFAAFSAFENCRLAAQAHATGVPSFFRAADRYPEWNTTANDALASTGLAARADVPASQLSHGERRALDIAMALATRPSVLLLDEPLAGMGPEEAANIVSLLRRLAVDHAILLIEHDMDAVFALAHQLTVMANGRVLASGTPEEIRANAEVQEVYLGTAAPSANTEARSAKIPEQGPPQGRLHERGEDQARSARPQVLAAADTELLHRTPSPTEAAPSPLGGAVRSAARADLTSASALLDARGLNTYYGSSHALQGVDFAVGRGEVVALMGRNGMGKTTLIRTLLGLVRPRTGDVYFEGASIVGLAPNRIARAGLAYVPEGRGIFPTLSVRENLAMAARAQPGSDAWTLDRVLATFPRLAERMEHRGSDLSGGEQQMLTLGRALLTDPRLLLLDEATEGLAPLIARDIWRTIGTVRQAGTAMVIVDKNFAMLSALADRCVILVKGRKVFDAAPGVLAAEPGLRERYLGV